MPDTRPAPTTRSGVQVAAAVVALVLGVVTLGLLDKALSDLGSNKAGGAALYLVLFTVALVVTAVVAARSMRQFDEH